MSPAQVQRLIDEGMRLLDGVGMGQTFIKRGGNCVHVRRQLSEGELALLSAEWLAIPPVDMAG
jgi:hypothetical protein